MSYASCSKSNINHTDTTTRQRKTTNFKNKSPQLPHSKYFLQEYFFTAPNFNYQAKKRLKLISKKSTCFCAFKSFFVVNSFIVKSERVALSKMCYILQSVVFQTVPIQQQLLDNQLWKFEYKLRFLKLFLYNFCFSTFIQLLFQSNNLQNTAFGFLANILM